MNPEIIHRQLTELLETIQEQFETLSHIQGPFPQIEVDLLRDNLRKFYDQLTLLEKTRAGHAPPQPAPTRPPDPTPTTPTIPNTPPSFTPSPKPPHSEVRAGHSQPKPPDLDLFASEEPTFSMKLKEARQQTLPPKNEPVQHLKQLISINDKFSFINELFDGSLKEYNDAIEKLNGCNGRNEAYEYLDQLRKKNLWELESGTLMKLKEAVEKFHS